MTARDLDPAAVPLREPIPLGALADRALARASGADPVDGNAVRLLLDAGQNYEAWLDAIRRAERSILFESYMVDDDRIGREFATALADRARAGVDVRIVYDWLGSYGSGALWDTLASAGARPRAFNPPQIDSPLGWFSRDHRKTIVVDGRVGFVSGVCVSAKWLGEPERRLEPWRDTGIEVRGPAVTDLAHAFAQVWHASGGEPLPAAVVGDAPTPARAGDVRVRVIAGTPNATGTYRLDLAIASLAHQRLWLTDAYFVGTAAYVQALAAAARDGVDVRLLVPGASDIPALSPLSRAAYRALLEAGVRVFEWNGTMLHAKTAVADGFWARVGSTNLNIASWMGNYELDVAIEDRRFAEAMALQYDADLTRATEIVLTRRKRVRPAEARTAPTARRALSGSAGRVAAGAVGVGSALGAALTSRRSLESAESGMLAKVGVGVIAVALLAAWWPRLVAWPLAFFAAWLGLAWLGKAIVLRRRARAGPPESARLQGGYNAERDRGDADTGAGIMPPTRP
jgi:cardiolipin synthase